MIKDDELSRERPRAAVIAAGDVFIGDGGFTDD
jgi:hypothetical protein